MAVCGFSITEPCRIRLSHLLAFLNFLLVLFGFSFIGVGTFVTLYLQAEMDLLKESTGETISYLFISTGLLQIVIFGFGTFLCVQITDMESRKRYEGCLFVYFLFQAILVWVVLACACMCLSQRFILHFAYRLGFLNAMVAYKDDPVAKVAVDRIQMDLRCCGSSGYKDWFKVGWIDTKYTNVSANWE